MSKKMKRPSANGKKKVMHGRKKKKLKPISVRTYMVKGQMPKQRINTIAKFLNLILMHQNSESDVENDLSEDHVPKSVQINTRATRDGAFLMSLLLNKEEQEAAIGDFFERYAQKLTELGKWRADFWAYSDVASTVWPTMRRKLSKAAGFVGAAEWIRRHLF